MAEQSHLDALEASRTATLNSLRSSGRAMTSNMSTNAPPQTTDNPSTPTPDATPINNVIHANLRGDADFSTLTGTGDGTTPSSRSSVSFHCALTSGTHHGALNTLRTAVLKCFAASQAEYIRAFNAKAIEANLSKIAARQRTEECAESTAITINSESTPTPRTVGATIDARIRRSQQELEKRLQSLEQRLANKKYKSASFERRLQSQQQQKHATTQPQSARQQQQPAKDTGAIQVGATQKKSTLASQHTAPVAAKPRWTPPPPPTTQYHQRPAGRGERNNAITQNNTGRGNARYITKARPKHRSTPTGYAAHRR